VAGHGRSAAQGKVRDADLTLPTTEDLGLNKRRVAEWRKMVDAGEAVVLGAISAALDEGREATAADVKRAISGSHFTGCFEWYTPPHYIAAAREVLGGIDLDPASCETAQKTIQAENYYTKDNCGLVQDWHGRVWMNPPFATGLIEKFVGKLVEQYSCGKVTAAIALTDNRTDTGWFHALVGAGARVCFPRGRIGFYRDDKLSGMPRNGQTFFYPGREPEKFDRVFARFGFGGSFCFAHAPTSGTAS